MDDKFSCILFDTPVKTCLPRTYINYKFEYVLYEELESKLNKKSIIF